MCNLGIQLHFSQQQISREQLALKKKNDSRAFALLKAIAATQTSCSSDLSDYPALKKAIEERNKSNG